MQYESPAIEDFGSLVEITAGLNDGEFTDADFPIHTPRNIITFS